MKVHNMKGAWRYFVGAVGISAVLIASNNAVATHATTTTLDFEAPLPIGLVASTDRLIGDFVPLSSRITNHYADQGVLFEDVGLLYLEPHFGMPATNFLQSYDANGIVAHDVPYKFIFVSPADETVMAATTFFSIDSDRLGGSGLSFTASAYDVDDNFLGSATAVDTSFPGPGSPVTLHNIGQIHYVILQGAYSIGFDILRFGPVTPIPPDLTELSCGDIVGKFEPPLQSGSPVRVKKNRVIPYKALLWDADDFAVTDGDLETPPVIQVSFTAVGSGETIDVTDDALPAGQGSDGNQFVYSDDAWQYNLRTKNYSASGLYTVDIISGDPSEYVINPSCQSQFAIEPGRNRH